MNKNIILGVLIPFLGTTLGAGTVFFCLLYTSDAADE